MLSVTLVAINRLFASKSVIVTLLMLMSPTSSLLMSSFTFPQIDPSIKPGGIRLGLAVPTTEGVPSPKGLELRFGCKVVIICG